LQILGEQASCLLGEGTGRMPVLPVTDDWLASFRRIVPHVPIVAIVPPSLGRQVERLGFRGTFNIEH